MLTGTQQASNRGQLGADHLTHPAQLLLLQGGVCQHTTSMDDQIHGQQLPAAADGCCKILAAACITLADDHLTVAAIAAQKVMHCGAILQLACTPKQVQLLHTMARQPASNKAAQRTKATSHKHTTKRMAGCARQAAAHNNLANMARLAHLAQGGGCSGKAVADCGQGRKAAGCHTCCHTLQG
jgi:hypothetical protein